MDITTLTDRELQEQICRLLYKQERHQKYFSNVLTVFIVLNFIAIAAAVVFTQSPVFT